MERHRRPTIPQRTQPIASRFGATIHRPTTARITPDEACSQYEQLAVLAAPRADPHERLPASLSKRFDQMLTSLHAPDAGNCLPDVMRKPVEFGGKAKAGQF